MTNSLKIRLALALVLLGGGLFVTQHPDSLSTTAESAASWLGLSSRIDTLVLIYESAEVTKYGKGNHPGWAEIIGSATLKDAADAKGVKLVGPLDKDTKGKFPPGVAEAIAADREKVMPRAIGLSSGKVKFDVLLPEGEAAVRKKAGI